MKTTPDYQFLTKFIVASTLSFFIGSVHGVLQVLPSIRAWLDSIGSPYGGPGHMIDPLAHAHINLIGGVTMAVIAISYYMLQKISGKSLYSIKMANFSFWATIIGIYSFYSTLVIFGIWEGNLLLAESPKLEEVHDTATIFIASTATVMGIGLWSYMLTVMLTVIKNKKEA